MSQKISKFDNLSRPEDDQYRIQSFLLPKDITNLHYPVIPFHPVMPVRYTSYTPIIQLNQLPYKVLLQNLENAGELQGKQQKIFSKKFSVKLFEFTLQLTCIFQVLQQNFVGTWFNWILGGITDIMNLHNWVKWYN